MYNMNEVSIVEDNDNECDDYFEELEKLRKANQLAQGILDEKAKLLKEVSDLQSTKPQRTGE